MICFILQLIVLCLLLSTIIDLLCLIATVLLNEVTYENYDSNRFYFNKISKSAKPLSIIANIYEATIPNDVEVVTKWDGFRMTNLTILRVCTIVGLLNWLLVFTIVFLFTKPLYFIAEFPSSILWSNIKEFLQKTIL